MITAHSFLDLDEKWGKFLKVKIYKLSKELFDCSFVIKQTEIKNSLFIVLLLLYF